MKKQLIFALIGISIFLKGCASISSPEGGERDLIAPKLISSYPKDGQTNVKPEEISLTFDEAIQTLDLTRQLITAPTSYNTYKSRVKGNTVQLTFSEPWQENTTYSLNFRNSLADVTEKNPAKNVTITFSTGAWLDSGSVSGNIGFIFNSKPPKEANILLYPTSDTSQVTKGKPLYMTSSDSSGNFQFRNIKEGNYFIYGLTETNNNLRYDNEEEYIAYAADSVQVKPRVAGIQLKLHQEDITRPNVVSRRGFTNVYEVEYNEGILQANVTSEDKDPTMKWLITNAGKTLRLFPAKPEEKRWLVEVQDSARNMRTDTIAVRLTGKPLPRRNNSFAVANGATVKPGERLQLQFEVPTKIVDPAGAFTFLLDSTTTVTTKEAKDLQLNQDATQITVLLPLEAKQDISIRMDTTKVLPYIGDPYAATGQKIVVSDKEDAGSLKVVLATERENFIVQLLRQGTVVKEVINQKTILWENLEPGSYQIRILVDENGNGRWDNGLLSERRLPEPVVLPADSWEIRANWEVETLPIEF